MDKKEFATLIDAYASAKMSRNQYLIDNMVAQIEQGLDFLFPESPVDPEAVKAEF